MCRLLRRGGDVPDRPQRQLPVRLFDRPSRPEQAAAHRAPCRVRQGRCRYPPHRHPRVAAHRHAAPAGAEHRPTRRARPCVGHHPTFHGPRRAGRSCCGTPVRCRYGIPLMILRGLIQRPPCRPPCRPDFGRCGFSRPHPHSSDLPAPWPCQRPETGTVTRSAGQALVRSRCGGGGCGWRPVPSSCALPCVVTIQR